MGLGAELAGEREAVADLDALDRLDAHHRRREPRVEPVVLRRVRAEPGRHARGARTSTMPPTVSRSARASSIRARSPSSSTVEPVTSMPIVGEQRLRDRAGRDVDRGVPRRRALERVADVGEAVLEHPGEVGVSGPGQRDGLRPLARAARPRAATGSSPTSSSCGRRCGRRAPAACRASAPGAGPRAPRRGPARSAGAASGRSPPGGASGRRRSPSRSSTSPAGRPVRIATSAGPCDSPAVARRRRHRLKA